MVAWKLNFWISFDLRLAGCNGSDINQTIWTLESREATVGFMVSDSQHITFEATVFGKSQVCPVVYASKQHPFLWNNLMSLH